MNISYNWLKDFIKLEVNPHKVAEILTSIGLEVGSVDEVQTVKGGLEGLVVGEVLTCVKHPDADKLSITTLNVGGDEPLPIVCGAPNVAAGQKVIVATIGTVLYSGDESFTIKKSKIRGELSMGMICAEDEIGLGNSHDGIMVLAPDAVVGTPAKTYFNIESDYCIEVDLTPNRIDAASHFGIARDLAAYLNSNGAATEICKPDVSNFKVDNTSSPIQVMVENSDAAPRYCGVSITGVEVKESPDWLKNRLKIIGQTPINNIVDVTNYVLFELGQPLHAFDAQAINGNKVIVKNVAENTKFVTLDGKERALSASDLMICNASEPMCIAGVFGGEKSGVSSSTTSIFLESAYFNPVWVRKTAKRHTLSTDASFRFERGIDPNITVVALKRAAMLIKAVAGGEISSNIVDIYPNPIADFKIEVKWQNITRLIGKELGKEKIKSILTSLDITIEQESDEALLISVPAYRVDVQREADVIEDILRIYGYNNVEMPDAVKSTIVYAQKPDNHKLKNIVGSYLTSNGFNEIMCNSLTKLSYYDNLETFPKSKLVELANPLSNDLGGMRQTLLFGGLESILHNKNRKNGDLKLFEFGNVYSKNEGEKGDLKKYNEAQHLSLFVTGNQQRESWNGKVTLSSFFDLKAYVFGLTSRLNVALENLSEVEIEAGDVFTEGLEYKLQSGAVLCSFGVVNPKLLKQMDVAGTVYYATINWDLLIRESVKKQVRFSEIPKFPEVRRDLALLLDKNIKFSQVKEVAFKTERKMLKAVSLFDVYEGEKIDNSKKSYAVSFILQDENQTLVDSAIEKCMSRLLDGFKDKLGATLR
ncbi:MAG: phenylalanine--tRNA ligase subunit beta [Breznakibacter sp.]|nr:phenylalanine--tRNA ligase subunit beta [Breznakibacter sp.]